MIPYGHQSINQDDIAAVTRILKSDWLTQGPAIEKFENAVARKVNTKYAVACSNGTAALHLASLAAGIGPGDEVIVPTLSFAASANCVLFCNGTPILCDIDLKTLTIDVNDIEKRINSKTKAIITVDFAGHPADWDKLKRIAKKHKLILIDDAAHALGAKYKGEPIGSLADLTTFSFHPVKAITTGEGGMIVTNNKNYFDKLRLFRNHGITKSIIHPGWYQEMTNLGYNYRLTDIQAALGLSQLKKLDKFRLRRRQIALHYMKQFSLIDEIMLPPDHENIDHAWHIFPVRFLSLNRDEIYNRLIKLGIKCQIHYLPIHLQPYYQKKFGYKKGDFPNTEKYASRCLTIPLYPSMTDKMVKKVTLAVQEAVSRDK